ncbi:MAG: response regulator transcription factor [Vicinamibacterales bacterium]
MATLMPGSRRLLLTMVCRASGASAAMTDGQLNACWHTQAGEPHPTAARLGDMTPTEDRVTLAEIMGRFAGGATHVHRSAPSGATYYAYDGRGTELNKIVWYWQPPPAEPAGPTGDADAPAPDPPRAIAAPTPEAAARLAQLSDRERSVVGPVLAGWRVKTISRSLFLSESTVRSHLSAAFKKLGVRSQAELVERYRLDPPPET